jgi:trigger factor
MKFDVEELSSTKRKLRIEIPADRVAGEFEQALRAVSRSARIKGFRPGHVPRPVLERYFAEDVRREVTSKLVREGLSSAVEESKLDVVSPPELAIESGGDKDSLRFSATVEIRPALAAIATEGFSAERPMVAIGDAQVDQVIEQLRQRSAELVAIADRGDVARGDFANVDIRVTADGTEIPSLAVKGKPVEVAAGQLPAPIEERLALSRVGETFSVEGLAPEGADPEVAGKTLTYTVTVNSIAERRLPEVDDEFAKDQGEYETLAQLRGQIAEQLERDARRRADATVRQSIVDQLLHRNPIDLPEAMVGRSVEEMLHELKHDLERRGLQFTDVAREKEARDKLRPRAEREVHAALLLDALAEQRHVEVGDEELADHLGRLVAGAGKLRDQAREHYRHEHARDAVRAELRRARVLEQLVREADVKEVAQNVE